MKTIHPYDIGCPCEDCIRQTLANRHGKPMEHEIMSGNAEHRAQGNVTTEHEVIGSQGDGPRSSGYGA